MKKTRGKVKSDTDLLRECKKGDIKAFEQLVLRHQETIYFFALRLVGNEIEAQDLAQNTFIQVFKNVHKFKEKSEFNLHFALEEQNSDI